MQKNRTARSIMIFILILGCNLNTAWAAKWISDYSGDKENIQISRDGKKIEFQIFSELLEGDKINIKDNESSLFIESDDGKINEIKNNTEFTVENTGTPSGLNENFSSWIGSWFGKNTESKKIAGLDSRGKNNSPIQILLSPANSSIIPENMETFKLFWDSEANLFNFQIINILTADVLHTEHGVNGKSILVKTPRAGDYLITLSSNTGSVDMILKVVDPALVPSVPESINKATLSENQKKMLSMLWIYENENAQWGLYAYNEILNLSEQYSPAKKLIRRIN